MTSKVGHSTAFLLRSLGCIPKGCVFSNGLPFPCLFVSWVPGGRCLVKKVSFLPCSLDSALVPLFSFVTLETLISPLPRLQPMMWEAVVARNVVLGTDFSVSQSAPPFALFKTSGVHPNF